MRDIFEQPTAVNERRAPPHCWLNSSASRAHGNCGPCGLGVRAMGLIVFDDKGVAWDAKSPRFAEALDSSIQGEELADYAVRNLGFVAAEAIHASARIRIRPAVMSQGALAALLRWLHDCAHDRILISSYERSWCHRVVRSRRDVLAHLTLDCERRNARAMPERLRVPGRQRLQTVLQQHL